MAYKKTIWVNDQTPLNADNMNNIENGIAKNEEDIAGLPNILLDKGTESGTDTKQVIYNSVEFKKQMKVADFNDITNDGGLPLPFAIGQYTNPYHHVITISSGTNMHIVINVDSTTSSKITDLGTLSNWAQLGTTLPILAGYMKVGTDVVKPLTLFIGIDASDSAIKYVDVAGTIQSTNLGAFADQTWDDKPFQYQR